MGRLRRIFLDPQNWQIRTSDPGLFLANNGKGRGRRREKVVAGEGEGRKTMGKQTHPQGLCSSLSTFIHLINLCMLGFVLGVKID